MNHLLLSAACTLGIFAFGAVASAETVDSGESSHVEMKEDLDGKLEAGEYQRVSATNAITRAHCPYTCEDRNLPKEQCRTWKAIKDKTLCYVEDTSKGSQAETFSEQVSE